MGNTKTPLLSVDTSSSTNEYITRQEFDSFVNLMFEEFSVDEKEDFQLEKNIASTFNHLYRLLKPIINEYSQKKKEEYMRKEAENEKKGVIENLDKYRILLQNESLFMEFIVKDENKGKPIYELEKAFVEYLKKPKPVVAAAPAVVSKKIISRKF